MHPRVLIVGTVPYNKQSSSRAFESYFHNWEKENLVQIYSNPREPVHGHCSSFYQITDKRMLMRHFNKNVKTDRKSTRLNSSHVSESRMPSSA